MIQEYNVITNPHNPLYGKSYEEVKEAVEENGLVLSWVEDQTKKLCRIAVQQDGYALQFVKSQTKELCNLAMARTKEAETYVDTSKFEVKRTITVSDKQ